MTTENEGMSRGEFLKRIFAVPIHFIIKVAHLLLLLVAVWVALSVYRVWEADNRGDALLLLVALLLITLWVGYRQAKDRYVEKIWNNLPPAVKLVGHGLRVIVLLLVAGFLLLVGLYMPIFMALVCVHLWIDNYKLREALEKKETQLTQAGGEPGV